MFRYVNGDIFEGTFSVLDLCFRKKGSFIISSSIKPAVMFEDSKRKQKFYLLTASGYPAN